jgi:hypothetical protein
MGLGLAIGQNVAAQSGGGTGTTWASNADWTLSNGNLTALRSGTSTFWSFEITSAAKTNGTAIFTVNAMGSASFNYIGFDNGLETSSPGSPSGNSITWRSDGALSFAGGGIATLASWTTGDQLKIVKAAGTYTFYKWNGTTWVQQGSPIDTTSATYGMGTVMAGNCYPMLASFNATGFQATSDFSGF